MLPVPGNKGVDNDSQQDNGRSKVEHRAELLMFTEKQGSQDDSVYRFKIVCQVNGENTQALEQLNILGIGVYGAEGGKQEQPPGICRRRDKVGRITTLQGNDRDSCGAKQGGSGHLVQRNDIVMLLLGKPAVEDGESGGYAS